MAERTAPPPPHGALFTRAEAAAAGIRDQRLTELVRRGSIARVARGVYAGSASTEVPDPYAVTRSSRVVVSHDSSAAWFGIDLPEAPGLLHLTAPRNRGRRRNAIAGARLHRARLTARDICVIRGLRVTCPARTAVDIARHASLEHSVAIVDSFLRAKLLTVREFAAAAQSAQGPGRSRIQLVATLIDPASGSILESLTRVLLWRHNLPRPTTQHPFRHHERGWIGYVDFAWPGRRAILECDGYEFHSSREPFQKDRRRWSAISSSGWRLAVVTWFDVTRDSDYVVAVVRDLLSPGD
jgi:very-short-patch-repair endonuclease